MNTKIMIVLGVVAVATIIAGLANCGIGALVHSPNGSFQDHLDTGLKITAAVLVAIMLILGAIAMAKELWPNSSRESGGEAVTQEKLDVQG